MYEMLETLRVTLIRVDIYIRLTRGTLQLIVV